MEGLRIIVAVSGASGSVYARRLLDALVASDEVAEVALIFSSHALAVAEQEGVCLEVDSPKVRVYDNGDMFAPPASGSAEDRKSVV